MTVERECQQVGREGEGEGGAGWLEEPALRTEWVEEAEDHVGSFVRFPGQSTAR